MNKYGIDNFLFEIIEECNQEMMEERERFWIKELNTQEPNGYNITPGGKKLSGEDNPFYGHSHSEETRQLLSKKHKGRIASEEEREMRRKINSGKRNPFYGKHHTDATKEKIKQSNIASGNYEKLSQRMKESNPNKEGYYFAKQVMMLDSNHEVINVFASGREAGDFIKEKRLSEAQHPGNSICDVCRGLQKTAFGFYWKYIKFTLVDNLLTKTCGYIIKKKK